MRSLYAYIKNNLGELLRYAAAGVLTTLVSTASYYALTRFLHVEYKLANVISVVLAIIFAYAVNKLFVFKTHCATRLLLVTEFAKFVGGRAVTLVIESFGVPLLVTLFHMNDLAAKIIVQVVVIAANFIVSKLIVFRRK